MVPVGKKPLDSTDGDGSSAFPFASAGAFALSALRADAAADFGEVVGFAQNPGSVPELAVLGQPEDLRDVVVEWTSGHAGLVIAMQAA
jgi:hypothetical protein